MKALIVISLACLGFSQAQKSCNLKRQKGQVLCTQVEAETLVLDNIIDLDYEQGIAASITRIEFRDSSIENLPKDTFKQFPSLSQLVLSNITLKSIDNKAFRGMRRLKLLDLSYNNVQNLHSDLFMSLNLIHLRLDGNPQLYKPTNGPIVDAKSLKSLSMKFCEIQHLPGSAFSETPLIESIDLANNLLTQLPVGIFNNVALKHLDISYNRFKTIDPLVFENIKGFPNLPNTVLANGNPWECSCNLHRIMAWATQDRETHFPTWDWGRTRLAMKTFCSGPNDRIGQTWMSYDDWNCL